MVSQIPKRNCGKNQQERVDDRKPHEGLAGRIPC